MKGKRSESFCRSGKYARCQMKRMRAPYQQITNLPRRRTQARYNTHLYNIKRNGMRPVNINIRDTFAVQSVDSKMRVISLNIAKACESSDPLRPLGKLIDFIQHLLRGSPRVSDEKNADTMSTNHKPSRRWKQAGNTHLYNTKRNEMRAVNIKDEKHS